MAKPSQFASATCLSSFRNPLRFNAYSKRENKTKNSQAKRLSAAAAIWVTAAWTDGIRDCFM